MKREDLEIIKDFKYVNEDGHYVLTKEQMHKITGEKMKTEQEKLVLSKEDWTLLIKKLSSVINKAVKLKKESQWVPSRTNKSVEQIQDKALECLDIIKYKNIKK